MLRVKVERRLGLEEEKEKEEDQRRQDWIIVGVESGDEPFGVSVECGSDVTLTWCSKVIQAIHATPLQ